MVQYRQTIGETMLKRKFYDSLLKWKSSHGKECLLVKGARQIGKTFIIDLFGKRNDLLNQGPFTSLFMNQHDQALAARVDPQDSVPGTYRALSDILHAP